MGFPTANLNLHHEAVPSSGVYIVKVKYKNRLHDGILNIGFRPTFEAFLYGKEPTVEVHLFDFSGNLYGQDLEVIFIKRIRSEQRFMNKRLLLARIEEDVRNAKRYFVKNPRF